MHDVDDSAIVGYPVLLTIILIVATLSISLLYMAIENLHRNIDIEEVEEQLSTIIFKAESMNIYASNNSIQTLKIHLPYSLYMIVLGGIPSETGKPTIDNETYNQYYYIMKDGTMKIYHSSVYFLSRNSTNIILKPGRYTITLELYEKNGRSYVTVYKR